MFPVSGANGGEGIQVVICGGNGLQTITLDLTNGTADEDPGQQVSAKCPFCIVGVAAFLPQRNGPAAVAEFHAFRYPLAAAALTPPGLQHSSPAIRAPPLTV